MMHTRGGACARRFGPAFLALVFVAVPHWAAASTVISFDPDGSAAANSTQQVSVVDFKVGNSLYQSIGSLATNGSNIATTHYIQAGVDGLLDANGNVLPIAGL